MDSFDQLIEDCLVSKQKVLATYEEWSLYCYYLQEAYEIPDFEPELRKAYNSPIRLEKTDNKPSFSVWAARTKGLCDYIWKDSGIGKSGNIFYLVGLLYGLKREEDIFRQIDLDFGGQLFEDTPKHAILPRLVKPPENKEPSSIRIKSKPFSKEGLAFWAKYGIQEEDLKYEEIYEVQYFWTTVSQQVPYTPQSLCFAYKIGSFYKLYQPYNKEFKFIQDYPEQFVEGWLQLEYKQPLCIITKSKKDVAVLRKLGYEAVSPKSETTMIQLKQMEWLLTRYERILVLFDNDGKHNGINYIQEYGLPLIFVPISSGTKDISDFRSRYGEEETKKLLHHLTQQHED